MTHFPRPQLRDVAEMTVQELVELHHRLSSRPVLGVHALQATLQPRDDEDAGMPPAA